MVITLDRLPGRNSVFSFTGDQVTSLNLEHMLSIKSLIYEYLNTHNALPLFIIEPIIRLTYLARVEEFVEI